MYGRGHQTSFGPPATPPIVRNLLIANFAVYIAQFMWPPLTLIAAVTPEAVWQGWVWQPLTYMWLHSTQGIFHILFNMFALWMFGSPLALAWGEKRFLRYYLSCGVGAGVVIAGVPYVFDANTMIPTLGASGAVMGVLLAYSFTWPERTIMLIFPPIPIKAIWLIPLILFMELTSGPGNVSHAGHLGGVLVGWIFLVNEGKTPGAPTIDSMKHKWKRHQMRQRLRSVRDEEVRERKRQWQNDDHRYH